MKHEREYINHNELKQEILIEPPLIESFFDSVHVVRVWPESIATNEVFLKQIKDRKELNVWLDGAIDRLPRPDISLETAINQGMVTEEQAAKLYGALSDLLESGDDYKRLALYIPFEFLPNGTWKPFEKNLQRSIDRFKNAYMETWKDLLTMHDVRANFVDGDVLEEHYGDGNHPRVVKAAHLIPKLVESGLIKFEEIVSLMEESEDQLLKDSIADTFSVMADLGLITEKEIKLMEGSDDRLIRNMARIIVLNLKTNDSQTETAPKIITLSSVREGLDEKFSGIENEIFGDITEKRKLWLKQIKKQKAIEALGEDIGKEAINDNLTDETVMDFLKPGVDIASQQALVEGIRMAIESAASTDPEKAQTLYSRYGEILLTLWKSNIPEMQEGLTKTFCRLNKLKIVDDKQLAELGIFIPELAGRFSENLKNMGREMSEVRNMIKLVESSSELIQYIYPAVLIYGSRVKGYGGQNSDIDLGVFVRPETTFSDREKLQALLENIFKQEKVHCGIVEFWLEEEDDKLSVHDFEGSDVSLGESYATHVLFGAAWEGDKDAIRELREKLLTPYLYDTEKMIQGREARKVYIEELERDTLQYRLMHKGYESYNPPYGGINAPHSDEIDGDSMFWDSGYRQLATRLYASRVFLPKIPKPEK